MKALSRAQWLANVVLGATALCLLGLLGRVAWLEKHVTPAQLQQLQAQNTAPEKIESGRATIFASDGTPIATSVRMYNLYCDPGYILDRRHNLNALKGPDVAQAEHTMAQALAPLLQKPAADIEQIIEINQSYANGEPRRFLWLAREVDEDFHRKFQEIGNSLEEQSHAANRAKDHDKAQVLAHALDGVNFVQSTRRTYPLGTFAGQVIGFGRTNGLQGLENQLDDLLAGRPGEMLAVKDAQRHNLWIKDDSYRPPDNGRDVWLTMDTTIQGIAEEELAKTCTDYNAQSGVAIVMDPFTGKILAMANWPAFDPADYAKTDPARMRNKAVTDPYEPGSIIKPFVLSWALENHVVKRTDTFNCHLGTYYDPTGRVVKDVENYGNLSVEDILVKSSNIGMTQIGWKMGTERLHEAVKKFGFGDLTGVELPGDEKGLVKPLAQWNKGTLTSVSFGYELAATPLQLVRGFSTFANNGYLITPRVVGAVEDRPGHAVPWNDLIGDPPRQRILSGSTCQEMREIMEGVFLRGTAKKAESSVYRFFGKTGTAHLAVQGEKHYADDQYNSSFLAGGPFTNPRLVAIVAVHKPDRAKGHFGGTVAAPACSKILERALEYMQVPGDQTKPVNTNDDVLAGF